MTLTTLSEAPQAFVSRAARVRARHGLGAGLGIVAGLLVEQVLTAGSR